MRLILAALLILLAAVPGARAATVSSSVQQEHGPKGEPYDVHRLAFTAAAGERNDLAIAVSGQEIRIADAGAEITPSGDCTSISVNEVRCPVRSMPRDLQVTLGDGDDRFRSDVSGRIAGDAGNDDLAGPGSLLGSDGDDTLSGSGTVNGGPGTDRITLTPDPPVAGLPLQGGYAHGGPGSDVVRGSAGADSIDGGGGIDDLRGGDGDDRMSDGDLAFDVGILDADEVHGEGGRDHVTLANDGGPMTVDLTLAGQQVTGVPDAVTGFENARTGAGDDVIRGDAGPTSAEGGPGDDRIDGGGGDDNLAGGRGDDVLSGGDGVDTIDGGMDRDEVDAGAGDDVVTVAHDFFADLVRCGTGRDTAMTDGFDRLDGCERRQVFRPARAVDALERRGRLVRARVNCDDVAEDCRGATTLRVRLGSRRRTLGRVAFGCEDPSPCHVFATSRWVRLPAAAYARLRRDRRLAFDVVTEFGDGARAGAIRVRERATLRLRAGR